MIALAVPSAAMSGLNAAQRAAVEHETGPLLVLAGAGSGKTRVITHRISRLIERGTPPDAILAVSFTNKAAEEMRERMAPLVGNERAARIWLSTFHSFGVRFLSEEVDALGYGAKFVVFDQGDSLGALKELIKRHVRGPASRKLDPNALLARISLWKNKFLAPEVVAETDVEYDAAARELYPRYEASLRAMCAVDFDDLVCLPVRILRDHDAVRSKWRSRFRHLLIDEFQDTNVSQLELVKLLTNELGNICAVGDDDQSIYGWRGAEVKNILEFDRTFPRTTIVKLEDNYRSKAPILAVANAAIAQAAGQRHGKTLRAARAGGDTVRVVVADDAEAEAKFVADEIHSLTASHGVRQREIAILYRSNLQARAIEESLRERAVGYRVFGGTQFFDRKEVKDAAAYLRLVVNPHDEISLRRVLNYPARGIGESTVERIDAYAKRRRVPFARALGEANAIENVPDAALRSISAFLTMIDGARRAYREGSALSAVARSLLGGAALRADLVDSEGAGTVGVKRWENVEYLLGSLERFEKRTDAEKPTLAAFLARLTLRSDSGGDEDEPKNAVTLCTLHGAKGLEFPYVFLIGCVEGTLPHSRTTDPKVSEAAPTDVDEERRLFYVGVTRARERLYLTRPKRRMLRGKVTPLTPSRFLDGLPEQHVESVVHETTVSLGTDELAAMTRDLLARLGGAP